MEFEKLTQEQIDNLLYQIDAAIGKGNYALTLPSETISKMTSWDGFFVGEMGWMSYKGHKVIRKN